MVIGLAKDAGSFDRMSPHSGRIAGASVARSRNNTSLTGALLAGP
jgi:hypothetical protein